MTNVILVAPFAVEANHPKNCDLLIQSLTGVTDRTLRSRIGPNITVTDKAGRKSVSAPQLHGRSLPEIDGMVLKVYPKDLKVEIIDPLVDNEEQQDELFRYLRATRGSDVKYRGVPKREGKLDAHRMKTLCREVLRFIESGEMEWYQDSSKFDLDDVESLPGNFLLNPGSTIPNAQPAFEKDLPAYQEKLLNAGG